MNRRDFILGLVGAVAAGELEPRMAVDAVKASRATHTIASPQDLLDRVNEELRQAYAGDVLELGPIPTNREVVTAFSREIARQRAIAAERLRREVNAAFGIVDEMTARRGGVVDFTRR